MKITTVIFDLDGTLVDSLGDIVESVNMSLENFNMERLPADVIGSYVGEGLENLIEKTLGDNNKDKFQQFLNFYRETYKQQCLKSTPLYPGVVELLHYLKQKDIKITLATNKSKAFTKLILENLGILQYFDIVLSPEDVDNRKPHREVVDKIVDDVNGSLENTIIVGDSKFDILCAKNAGIYSCGVTYGIGSVESIIEAGADFIVSDIRKLMILL